MDEYQVVGAVTSLSVDHGPLRRWSSLCSSAAWRRRFANSGGPSRDRARQRAPVTPATLVRRFDATPRLTSSSDRAVGFLGSRRNHHVTVPLEDRMATTNTVHANVTVKIVVNDKGNPPGKLADAELHFNEGILAGLKLIGFGCLGAPVRRRPERHIPRAAVRRQRGAAQLRAAAADRGSRRNGCSPRHHPGGLRRARGDRFEAVVALGRGALPGRPSPCPRGR